MWTLIVGPYGPVPLCIWASLRHATEAYDLLLELVNIWANAIITGAL